MIKEITADLLVEEFNNYHKASDLVNEVLKCAIASAKNGESSRKYFVSKEYDRGVFELACEQLSSRNFAIEAVFLNESKDCDYLGTIEVFTYKTLGELPSIS